MKRSDKMTIGVVVVGACTAAVFGYWDDPDGNRLFNNSTFGAQTLKKDCYACCAAFDPIVSSGYLNCIATCPNVMTPPPDEN